MEDYYNHHFRNDLNKFIQLNNKKINFILRQKVKRALSNKEAPNQIVLTINTSQIRNVNEKNVKNQITKYEISLTAKVDILFLDKNKNKIFLSQN